jgi:integrase/recombinase XerD
MTDIDTKVPVALVVPAALALDPVLARPDGHAPAAAYLAHLTTLAGRRSMRTAVEMAAQALSGGRCTAETLPWWALRAEHIDALRSLLLQAISARTGRRYAPGMVNKVLAAVRGVLERCWLMGLLEREDLERIRKVEGVRHSTLLPGRDLTLAELLKLLASDGSPIGMRDAAAVALFFGAGLRRSELASMDIENYQPSTGSVTVIQGKGHKDRVTYLLEDLRPSVAVWLRVRGSAPGPLLCPVTRGGNVQFRKMSVEALYQRIELRVLGAGLQHCSPHDFRRTLIGSLLDAGVDLVTVSEMVGHSDPETTKRYDRRGERAKQRAAGMVRVPGLEGAVHDETEPCSHCGGTGRVKRYSIMPTPSHA